MCKSAMFFSFLSFFFLSFIVQIKLKLIVKLTGNGLVMRWSHNTVAISPKKVQVMTLNMRSIT